MVKFTIHYSDGFSGGAESPPPLKFSVPKVIPTEPFRLSPSAAHPTFTPPPPRGRTKPSAWSVFVAHVVVPTPQKWLEKPLTAVIEYYIEEYYNKKFPDTKITDAATLMAMDGKQNRLSSTATVASVGETTDEIHLAPSDGTASPAPPAPTTAAAPAAAAPAAAAPSASGESFTVTKEELESCFGLGATSRLLSHRRQRQLEEEQNAKKAKTGAPAPATKAKASALEDFTTLLRAKATLSTGKGQTWNQPLVDKILSAMEASPELLAFVEKHAAEQRKQPSKELNQERLQDSLKALTQLSALSLQHRVCGLASLLAVVVEVIKYRGADSLDMLLLLQRRWNLLGPKLSAEGGDSAALAPLIFQEIDRVAAQSLKKFFQRTLSNDEQEAEDKFVTVLARHMMKKAYNPRSNKSVALQMAEDALDDQDQFETTSHGKELKKMFTEAGWGDEVQDLMDAVYFRCELNQGPFHAVLTLFTPPFTPF